MFPVVFSVSTITPEVIDRFSQQEAQLPQI